MTFKNISITGLLAIGLMAISSCSNDDSSLKANNEEAMGKLNLASLKVVTTTIEVTPMSRAAQPDINDFFIVISDANGEALQADFYGNLPETVALPVTEGEEYTISVSTFKPDEVPDAEWESAYFTGSQNFSIKPNVITDVPEISCVLKNIMVDVDFSEDLRPYLGDDITVTVRSTLTGAELKFIPGNNETGYFYINDEALTETRENSLIATLDGTVDGNIITDQLSFDDVESGKYYKFTFGIKNPDSSDPWAENN